MRKRDKALLGLTALLLAVAIGDVARIVAVGGSGGGDGLMASAWACYFEPPWVWVVVPGDGDTVSGTASVQIGTDSRADLTGVNLYMDGSLVATLTSPPYAHQWDTRKTPNGPHNLKAIGHSRDGAIMKSKRIQVTIRNP